jgi:hypothetical protein
MQGLNAKTSALIAMLDQEQPLKLKLFCWHSGWLPVQAIG